MRLNIIIIALSLLVSSLALSGLDNQPELKKQSDAHQMFLLRNGLSRHPGSSDFYAGEVAWTFNDTPTCEERFKTVLAVEPKSNTAKQIHHILAYAAMREGRYGRSLREMDALLAIDPNDSDAKSTRPFIEALSHFPDQAVLQRSGTDKVTVQMEDGRLPLVINGKKAGYFIDTGANLSTLSESDALLFGMEIYEVKSTGADINGNRVLFRIARAKSLALGSVELRNVAFLVVAKDAQPFVDMEPGQRGLIGLPVLLELGSVTWNREGAFEADLSPSGRNLSAANICFDDLNLITEARFEGHAYPFVLDTGAVTSDLWPRFAGVARDLMRTSSTHESHTVTGVGGGQKFESTSIPKVVLELGGKSVVLQPAHIVETQQGTTSKWFYGNLGVDLLRQAETVTINFKAMTLKLESPAGVPMRGK
jgi:hypothetical protein